MLKSRKVLRSALVMFLLASSATLITPARGVDTLYYGLLDYKIVTSTGTFPWIKCSNVNDYIGEVTLPPTVDLASARVEFTLTPNATASVDRVPQQSGGPLPRTQGKMTYMITDGINTSFHQIEINPQVSCTTLPNLQPQQVKPTDGKAPSDQVPTNGKSKNGNTLSGGADMTCMPSQSLGGYTWIFEYRSMNYTQSSKGKSMLTYGPSEVKKITKWVAYHRSGSGSKWKKATYPGTAKGFKVTGSGNGIEYGVVGFIGNEQVCNEGYPGSLGSEMSLGFAGAYNDVAYKAAMAKADADAKADIAWEAKQARIVCDPNGSCPLGSTGPGGGIIFYDAGSKKSWGRYLEVAPTDQEWSTAASENPDSWCTIGEGKGKTILGDIQGSALKGKFGRAIGTGASNTKAMRQNCLGGASAATNAHDGGTKTDWFLPSRDELTALTQYAFNTKSLEKNNYYPGSGNTKAAYYYKKYLRAGLKSAEGAFSPPQYWSSTPYNPKIDGNNGSCNICAWVMEVMNGNIFISPFSTYWISVRFIRYV